MGFVATIVGSLVLLYLAASGAKSLIRNYLEDRIENEEIRAELVQYRKADPNYAEDSE